MKERACNLLGSAMIWHSPNLRSYLAEFCNKGKPAEIPDQEVHG